MSLGISAQERDGGGRKGRTGYRSSNMIAYQLTHTEGFHRASLTAGLGQALRETRKPTHQVRTMADSPCLR